MSEATIIAKILWYTGSLSLQRLAWFLEISVGAVKNIIDSDAYLDAIVELIRTRPDRTGVSIEDWWENEWKNKPQRFSKRMKIPEAKIGDCPSPLSLLSTYLSDKDVEGSPVKVSENIREKKGIFISI